VGVKTMSTSGFCLPRFLCWQVPNVVFSIFGWDVGRMFAWHILDGLNSNN